MTNFILRFLEDVGIQSNLGIYAKCLIRNVLIFRKHPKPAHPHDVVILRDPVLEFQNNIKIPEAFRENRTGTGTIVSVGRKVEDLRKYDRVLFPRIKDGGLTYIENHDGYYGYPVEYVIIDCDNILAIMKNYMEGDKNE